MNGLRVFIVEDEAILLCDLEDMATHMGLNVIGSATSLDQAMKLISSGLEMDIALLDMNLNGQSSDPIADRLLENGVALLFVSGYGRHGLTDRFSDCHILQKPYDETKLSNALQRLLASRD
jgi:CheY-like chemotaxis protein